MSNNRPSVLVPRGIGEADIGILAAAAPAAAPAYTQRGSTQHFTVSYDQSLGVDGQTIADAILAVCENDYTLLQADFGGISPNNLPFNIYVTTGNRGASHATCPSVDINIGARTTPIVNTNFMCSLVVAEEDEVFEATVDRGWDCLASNGEGLSRVLANDMYPGSEPTTFVSADSWLDTADRPDFVTNTDPHDTNYISIGCSVLFLNWLRSQLGFTWNSIILAGAPNLAQMYANLTGRQDGWNRFHALLESRYPLGSPSGVTTDNPFPLTGNCSLRRFLVAYGADPRAGIRKAAPGVHEISVRSLMGLSR